jgi:hypothetical protein
MTSGPESELIPESLDGRLVYRRREGVLKEFAWRMKRVVVMFDDG